MALLYHRQTVELNTKDIDIRLVDEEGDHAVAITFPSQDDLEVTELLLTKEEVEQIYDVLFNK